MDSCDDTPKGWVAPFGHPRINACSRLPVAFRSVPRPSSPPGAKASTECPSLARDHSASSDAHPPCTETILSGGHPQRTFCASRITLAQHITVASEHPPPLERRSVRSDLRWQRPETHQNLIHPDKDPSSGLTRGPAPGPRPDGASLRRHLRHRNSIRTNNADYSRFSAIRPITSRRSTHIPVASPPPWWWR